MKDHVRIILEEISRSVSGPVNLMEVCGTHTMSIARSGLRQMLPPDVHLLSGPGCPVCVTPPAVIDAVLRLSERPDVLITTYGDMLRVPGSRRGDSLAARRAGGARVEMVYSPLDAVALAMQNPDKKVVFLGVGFETTAPGTAAALQAAANSGVSNFSVWSMLKTVEPALRALTADPAFNVQGFLCPGHVATIIGEEGFRFIPDDLHLPAVIGGFEPAEILLAVYMLLRQIRDGKPALENAYPRAVKPEGNPLAREMMSRFLKPREDLWRGLGRIPASGLGIRREWEAFDAEKIFDISYEETPDPSGCRCGDVIRGQSSPASCPLFGKVCTPEDPVGPCMVSSEGACAAYYKYE